MALKPTVDPATFINDAAKVTSVYAAWPTFHDAEILGLELNREGRLLFVRVCAFEANRQQVDAQGYFKKTNPCVITFRFANVENLSIEGFNHQNVLADIVFEPEADGIRVNMQGVFGADITFQCSTATVEEVVRTG